jgi:hypothetical protein
MQFANRGTTIIYPHRETKYITASIWNLVNNYLWFMGEKLSSANKIIQNSSSTSISLGI